VVVKASVAIGLVAFQMAATLFLGMPNLSNLDTPQLWQIANLRHGEFTTRKWQRFIGDLKFIGAEEFNFNIFMGMTHPMFLS
jgi:hypothetical protein